MHVIAIDPQCFSGHLALLAAMFRLRRKIFKDRLDWSVSVSGDLELDVYDTLAPTYLVVVTDSHEVIGCVRFLPTTGPTMLADTFPILLDGQSLPRSDALVESSRFCIDTERAAELAQNGLRRATFILFAGMIEWARLVKTDAIVTVTDLRLERILRRAGWPLERIGTPKRIGDTVALAGYLPISEAALATVRETSGLKGSVLRDLRSAPMAA
jgi:acyl homoserine lactone synthase